MFYNKNVLDWLAPDARNVMAWVRILLATSFSTVLIVEPTEYVEYKIKDGLFYFNFLYEAVATLQVTCTLYMQLTFYRGRIIHAINSNGLDVTLLFPA